MYKTINQEWITDRVPTEADSDVHGYIWIPSNDLDGFDVAEYYAINIGEPWMHCPKAPPYVKQKTFEEWLELLPDGYRERAIANIDENRRYNEDFSKSIKVALLYSFNWDDSKEGREFWQKVYDSIDHDDTINYLLLPPLPDKKEYWSKPSDLPSVCWVMSKDNPCCILVTLTKTEYFLSNSGRSIYYGDYLKDFRWSDRPFDNFEDGKECIKFRGK